LMLSAALFIIFDIIAIISFHISLLLIMLLFSHIISPLLLFHYY
jgi:hypothetical protein